MFLRSMRARGPPCRGVGEWTHVVGDRTSWSKAATVIHAVCGFTVLVLAGAKLRGSVRLGMRRGPASWWPRGGRAPFCVTIALGVADANGCGSVWRRSVPLTDCLAAFRVLLFVPLAHPPLPGSPQVDRSRFWPFRAGSAVAVGAVVDGAQEVVSPHGLAGGSRRPTGFPRDRIVRTEPHATVSWINDEAPAPPTRRPAARCARQTINVAGSANLTTPRDRRARLHRGLVESAVVEAIPLVAWSATTRGRQVGSITGYSRLFPFSDLDELYLAAGYGGQPLRRGHGVRCI